MDDLGINEYLKNTYGTAMGGNPVFRIIWSTGLTEKRYSEFHDYLDNILLRVVKEVREVLVYPFAQDRWILERLIPLTDSMREFIKTDDNYTYHEIYIFQDKHGNFLPLNREIVDTAMFLFFSYYLKMSWTQKADLQMALLAKKELDKRKQIEEATKNV